MELLDERQVNDSTVILDVDGTLTADANTQIPHGVLQAVQRLAELNTIYVFSNHPDRPRNRAVASSLGLRYLDTPHRKPSRKVLDGLPAEHRTRPLVVIGDKITIDGLFAWHIGARFIKVGRVVSPSDRRLVRLTYFLDDVISVLVDLWRVAVSGRRQPGDGGLRCPSSRESVKRSIDIRDV